MDQLLNKDLEGLKLKPEKKRCPFLVTKKENPHVWYDAKCMVTYSEFKIKPKGFSIEHGCFHLAHQKCEYFLKALQDEFWRKFLAKKGLFSKIENEKSKPS